MRRIVILSVALAVATTLASSQNKADTPDASRVSATFADPVRLMAGDKMLGEGRLYPSPVCQDMNGDGMLDIVVGDLLGKITVALRLPGDGAPRFGKDTKLMALDGKEIDFGNW